MPSLVSATLKARPVTRTVRADGRQYCVYCGDFGRPIQPKSVLDSFEVERLVGHRHYFIDDPAYEVLGHFCTCEGAVAEVAAEKEAEAIVREAEEKANALRVAVSETYGQREEVKTKIRDAILAGQARHLNWELNSPFWASNIEREI